MLCKRIIPCLDVKEGRVVKGINFLNLKDAGDPVTLAKAYYEQGADELVFLDVSASLEGRKTMKDVAKKVANEIFIPFTIGGGIKTIDDIKALLKSGADKISIGTAGIENPEFIRQAANAVGSQAIVISLDAKKVDNGKWKVYTRSATNDSEIDAIKWAKKVEELGAGEILLNSIDSDGTKKGFDIELNNAIMNAVNIPVIASGGAGKKQDFLDVFKETDVSAALAASIFHYGEVRIPELKKYLKENGVEVRENW